MALSIPLQWRREGHAIAWVPMDELVYQDIVDGATNVKWEIATLPVAPNTLEVRAGPAGDTLWRERDPAGSIVRGGLFPPWMLVNLNWSL